MIRKSKKPLQQVINRVIEGSLLINKQEVELGAVYAQEHFEGPLLPNCRSPQYKELKLPKCTIKLNSGDCYIRMLNHVIVKVRNIVTCLNQKVIIGQEILEKQPFFLHTM
ncbi:hypothetical protein NQ314_008440 [Rhamnusium bicolor]|uniref:Uncharacterized protein n=1 Tax=Rhamnusium bicolor TaxID=1586634 RepID=A0AAV8Y9J9_9CUCU|nr:hypothetical protein NQ314_008440 [Rhamnusium bicolor]